MYRCHMEFYLINCQPEVLEVLRELPPLEAFNHSFLDSREPREAPLARADVILAVPTAGAESVRALAEGKKDSAQLILLADKEQTARIEDSLSLADQPVPGGYHQQHPQPCVVQGQKRHPRKGERFLLRHGEQDKAAGTGPGPRLYLGCGAGRPGVHRV